MKIGYVCINFNNSGFTRNAVRSLVAGRESEYGIVVVDNNSDNNNVRELHEIQKEFPCVDLVLLKENLGYFRGLNVGIRRLRDTNPLVRYIVIGNNDLVFPEKFAAKLEEQIKVLSAHAVISPDIVTLDGLHQNPHVIEGIGWMREIVYDLYHLSFGLARIIQWAAKITHRITDRRDEAQWQIAQSIYQGHGSCYILGPLFFQNFTELWAPTFLFGEEYFLSKQLNDKGLKVYYEPSISVQHHCHAAIGKIPAKKMWKFSRDAHRVYRQHVKVFG